MEGPKRYFPTTGKTDAYGHFEILNLNALSAGFDENKKPIPYIVIAHFYTYWPNEEGKQMLGNSYPIPIYSNVDFANPIELTILGYETSTISDEEKRYMIGNKKIYRLRKPIGNKIKQKLLIIYGGNGIMSRHNYETPLIKGQNIDFLKIEIINVLINYVYIKLGTFDFVGTEKEKEYSYPFKEYYPIYFVSWYRLNEPNGKAVLYDEVEATQIMENCINCNSSYKFIERSKEYKTFCSKDCQVEHYRLN